jgi:hypothetical protein
MRERRIRAQVPFVAWFARSQSMALAGPSNYILARISVFFAS